VSLTATAAPTAPINPRKSRLVFIAFSRVREKRGCVGRSHDTRVGKDRGSVPATLKRKCSAARSGKIPDSAVEGAEPICQSYGIRRLRPQHCPGPFYTNESVPGHPILVGEGTRPGGKRSIACSPSADLNRVLPDAFQLTILSSRLESRRPQKRQSLGLGPDLHNASSP
jgi:hypothetical protein